MAWRMLVRGMHWESSLPKRSKKVSPLQERKMMDKFTLRVRGGHGGSGSSSFRKSRHCRHGRVDGGSGGVGGNVILRSTSDLFDFSNLRHSVVADDGGSGTSKKQIGKRGADKVVMVPLGTVVHFCDGEIPKSSRLSKAAKRTGATEKNWIKIRDDDGELSSKNWIKISAGVDELSSEPDDVEEQQDEEKLSDESDTEVEGHDETEAEEEDDDDGDVEEEELSDDDDDIPKRRLSSRMIKKSNIAELLYPNDTLLVALGGSGGRGNSVMPKVMVGRGGTKFSGQADKESGTPGTEAVLLLELKTIADIGLVGAPNAGKSTLLGAISKAKPNVGDYAFTTLRPSIGRVEYEDFYALSVADIPGLITGAHDDRGLGFDFLRHVERTKVFAYVLDCSLGLGDRKGSFAWEQLEELMFEMECYREGMTKRPGLVVANKTDEDGAEAIVKELRKRIKLPVYPTCAVLGEGIPELKEGLRLVLESADIDAPDLQELRTS